MNDSNTTLILNELRATRKEIDRIIVAIHGDGGKRKGLVRNVDALSFEVKLARWILGIVFSSVVLAASEHWFIK